MNDINTNVDLGGQENTAIDTSSSISTMNSTSNSNNTYNTTPYQTSGVNNFNNVEEVDLSLETGTGDISFSGAGSNLAETASKLEGDVDSFGSKVGNFFKNLFKKAGSTGAVVATTVTSGVGDIVEGVSDGLAWTGGKVTHGASWLLGSAVGLFNEDAGESIKDFGRNFDQEVKEAISVDVVGEINEWFYENTPAGRWINDNSLLKYDSEAAQKIRGITEKAAEVAAAIALTVFTGGAAAPLAVGLLYGMGTAGESTYQQNGTNTSLLQELGIAGSGVLTGLSWMATGKLGAGFLEIGKTAAEVGVKEVVSKISKDILTKEFWKNALKEGLTGANGVGNYVASAMMTGEDLIPYITGEKDFDAKAAAMLGLEFLKNLGFNIAEDALRGYIGGFKATEAIESITSSKINDELSEADLEKITAGTPLTDATTTSSIDKLEDTGALPVIRDNSTIENPSDPAKGSRARSISSNTKSVMQFDDGTEFVDGYPTKFVIEIDGKKVYFDGYVDPNDGSGNGAVKHFIQISKKGLETRVDASDLGKAVDAYIDSHIDELDDDSIAILRKLKENNLTGSIETKNLANKIKAIATGQFGIDEGDFDSSKFMSFIDEINENVSGIVINKDAGKLITQAGIANKVLSDELGEIYKSFKGMTYQEIIDTIAARGTYLTNEECDIVREIMSESSNTLFINAVRNYLSGKVIESNPGHVDLTGILVHMDASTDASSPFITNIITRPNVDGRDLSGDLSVFHLTTNDNGAKEIAKVNASTVENGLARAGNGANKRGERFAKDVRSILIGDEGITDPGLQQLAESAQQTGAQVTLDTVKSIIMDKIEYFFSREFYDSQASNPNAYGGLQHYIADDGLRKIAADSAFGKIANEVFGLITGGK